MPRKGSKRMTFDRKVKAIVRDELAVESENKVAVIGFNDIDVNTAAIPNGDVATSTNFIKLMPLISQGNGQYNQRVGNEIRLKSLEIKMLLNLALADLTTTQTKNTAIGVRVMILRQRDQNSQLGVIGDFKGDKLMELGNIINPGPGAFAGDTFNLVQKINREQFVVRYDKTFQLDAPHRFDNTGVQFPTKTKVMKHTLRFGKQGLKLTFGDANSESLTNFPYIMVIGYASTATSSTPDDDLVRYSYSSNANYTDM